MVDRVVANVPWRVRPAVKLTWHDWPDEGCVAFDDFSGQIVEFDVLGGAAMACLESGARTVTAVADMLAADLGHTADQDFRIAVGEVVEQFHRLGWVDPIIEA